MLENDLIAGGDWLSRAPSANTRSRPDLPDCVVGGLAVQADLLVAREAGKGKRGDGLRLQVQWLVANVLVRLNANLLSVPDQVIGADLVAGAAGEMNNGASAGTNSLLSGGHIVRLIIAPNAVAHVADEPSVREAVLDHDSVTEVERFVFSVSVRHLKRGKVGSETKRLCVDTYASVRLGKLLLGLVHNQMVSLLAAHVGLDPIQRKLR